MQALSRVIGKAKTIVYIGVADEEEDLYQISLLQRAVQTKGLKQMK